MSYTVRELSFEEISALQEIGSTIRKQIGINNLMAVGAREFRFLPEFARGIQFKVNHGRKRQFMTIALNGSDYYDVALHRQTKTGFECLEVAKDVDCEMLSETVYHMVNK